MKNKSYYIAVACGLLAQLALSSRASAQTTWGGSHIFNGNVNVGTTGTTGNLVVTGSTGNTASPGLKVTGDGGVVFTGSYGVGQIPETGAGTRFMWYPKKAALVVGNITESGWDDSYVGENSIALGGDAVAAGNYSVVLGGGLIDSGSLHSISLQGSVYSGNNAIAIGGTIYGTGVVIGGLSDGGKVAIHGSAFGDSIAIGGGEAYTNSIAIGPSITDSGGFGIGHSVVVGIEAVGLSGIASGDYSVAILGNTVGVNSIAIGKEAVSVSASSTAIGRNGDDSGNSSEWIETDPLFIVGNGTGDPGDPPDVERRNAFTVYKNGNVVIPKRQGDILMGEFGNPE